MKPLLKPALSGALICCLFSSCLKYAKPDVGPVTFNSPGMAFDFNKVNNERFDGCTYYQVPSNGPAAHFRINGYSTSNGHTLRIDIFDEDKTLKVGETYSVTTSADTTKDNIFYNYNPNNGAVYGSSLASPKGDLTITEATGDHIKGTFTGWLYDVLDLRGIYVIYDIENGTFYAKYDDPSKK